MALRLVQPGEGNPRPLVLGFLVGGDLDPRLRGAFGPRACIVADNLAQGPMLSELLDFAQARAGLRSVSRLALLGYSAGCQRVRALRLAGVKASAYLLVDGTHASWPPAEWQIAWLRELAAEARARRVMMVATHTRQTYTEELPKGRAFACTWRVLRMATGWPLARAGTLEAPAVTRDGALWVCSYASAKADAKAHAAQYSRVVPEMCERHLGPWMQGERVAEARSGGSAAVLGLVGIAVVAALGATSKT